MLKELRSEKENVAVMNAVNELKRRKMLEMMDEAAYVYDFWEH